MNNTKDQSLNVPTFFNEGRQEELRKELESIQGDLPNPELTSIMGRGISVLEEARQAIQNLEALRIKNFEDRSITTVGAKLKTFEISKKVEANVFEKSQKVEEALQRRASEIDETINQPINNEAAGRFSDSIRNHLKSLPSEIKRVQFVQELIRKKQWEDLSAVLGSRYYLAGLSEKVHQSLLEEYKSARFSKEIKAKKFLQKLAGNVGKGYAATLEQFQKLDSPEVREAMGRKQAAEEAAEKVLSFKS